MALPKPVPGLVIRYSYRWHREFLAGREEGQKDRPCAIVAAIRADETGVTRALVLPVTHSAPDQSIRAVEIPAAVKQRLGLDDGRSWVVVSEWNRQIRLMRSHFAPTSWQFGQFFALDNVPIMF